MAECKPQRKERSLGPMNSCILLNEATLGERRFCLCYYQLHADRVPTILLASKEGNGGFWLSSCAASPEIAEEKPTALSAERGSAENKLPWLCAFKKPLSLPHQMSRQSPVFLTAAEVVKLVDTHVSGACVARHAGSSPAFGTKKPFSSLNGFFCTQNSKFKMGFRYAQRVKGKAQGAGKDADGFRSSTKICCI